MTSANVSPNLSAHEAEDSGGRVQFVIKPLWLGGAYVTALTALATHVLYSAVAGMRCA